MKLTTPQSQQVSEVAAQLDESADRFVKRAVSQRDQGDIMGTVHQFPVQRNQTPAATEAVADALGVAIDAAVGADASFEAREAAALALTTTSLASSSGSAIGSGTGGFSPSRSSRDGFQTGF